MKDKMLYTIWKDNHRGQDLKALLRLTPVQACSLYKALAAGNLTIELCLEGYDAGEIKGKSLYKDYDMVRCSPYTEERAVLDIVT